ncbi:hypothetical protein MTR67_051930 [Solanum verrucosum]|uniref:Uncharacterized protein n=1 Tax=Solanum verrucosum TaxID=315347 RepID=A0AAF0V622_SOLVR|nr:hypothetical protein MTR67_051930 [Solanum verrucosum]
MPPELDWVVY